jgi:predicted N-formylglutamate amidohydrolase
MTELAAPTGTLLATDEAAPVTVHNVGGASALLLVADHAGKLMPRALGDLGIGKADRERHIAWDIGIAPLARMVADELDATLIRQNYSRLVIDCNRPLSAAASIPEISELTPIPGNVSLSAEAKAMRAQAIFWPYHQAIDTELDRRQRAGRPTALIALHSFTPVFKSVARPMQAALLYHRDPRFAHRLLALLREQKDLVVGDNEPYFVSDATDYTIPAHGERRGIPHALIEIRQDLIAGEQGQRDWATILTRVLPRAYRDVTL